MATESKNNTMFWWLMFLITGAITVFMLIYVDEWFWVALPFSLTALTKAFNVI